MSSHISREMRSRMVRAFSRALVMHCMMEFGLLAEGEKFKTLWAFGSLYIWRKSFSSPAMVRIGSQRRP